MRAEWLDLYEEAPRPRVRFVEDYRKVVRALRQAHGRAWLVPVLRRAVRAGKITWE